MEYKSQHTEAEVVINYFNGRIGNLLSLGENDGETFSNSYDLIKLGWKATLVEPCIPAYQRIVSLYKQNTNISIFNFGVGNKTEKVIFYEPSDSLLGTTRKELLLNWDHTKIYNEVLMDLYSWKDIQENHPEFKEKFDFITIDCEGWDLEILYQMDLKEVQCICIEYSNKEDIYLKIKNYCSTFGLTKELMKNGENVILAR